ncbi:hypothetical protein A8C32_16695 [Flavivirga aquatica]|uniref:Uncharacterized protein n=1 Tax=Flavivirga aquatica TaxID=1849968 RepID=A0A1E5T8N8_9FLAO|nr:hypothetical protein [Flavivirga aquatica]OEK07743.1 hypothetical protein A8C32_16695 [Flavivirga aquatica]
MKLLQSIDKILASLGNIKAMERTHVDTYTEDLIRNIEGKKIAESKYGQLLVSFQNVSIYKFLNVAILSGSNVKTFNGCSLIFVNNKKETILWSDTKEIESDYSNVSNRWLTKISFVVSEAEEKMIVEQKFDKVFLNYKKKSLPMNKCN